MWLPPVIQQLTGHPGNFRELVSFAINPSRATPTSHSLPDALDVVSNRATLVPLRNAAATPATCPRDLMMGVMGVLGAVVGVAAWRRSRFVALVALTTPLGILLALLATTARRRRAVSVLVLLDRGTQAPVTGPGFELRRANKQGTPPRPGETLMTAGELELRLRP